MYPASASEKPSLACALARSTLKHGWEGRLAELSRQLYMLEGVWYLCLSGLDCGLHGHPMTHIQLSLLLVEFLGVLPCRDEEIREGSQDREEINEGGCSCAGRFTEVLKPLP